MKIYLARHGQTDWNVAMRWQGSTDIPLNETGLKQAELLAQKMAIYPIKSIYSSPLLRAAKTADTVAKKFNIPVMYSKDLEEMRLGEWEGLTHAELLVNHKENFEQWDKDPEFIASPNIESHMGMQTRAFAAFESICHAENEDTLIVSHGAWINRLICKLLNLPIASRMNIFTSNVGLTIVDCNKETSKYTILTLNDFSHLQ